MHVPVPLQAPLQPVKVEPAAAVAVSVTDVPEANAAEQVAPQSIPAGELVTVPEPVPALVTVSVCVATATVAGAATAWFVATIDVQAPRQSTGQPASVVCWGGGGAT